MASILSFPFLAKTGFKSFKQPIANPPPPSLDSLTCSNITKGGLNYVVLEPESLGSRLKTGRHVSQAPLYNKIPATIC